MGSPQARHKLAHDAAASASIAVGRHPRLSRLYYLAEKDKEHHRNWQADLDLPSYRGTSFLGLRNPKGKPITPTTHKAGPFLKVFGYSSQLTARMVRCVTCHAPIGEYRARFFPSEESRCRCELRPEETRDHILRECTLCSRPHFRQPPRSVEELYEFLDDNPPAFAWDRLPFTPPEGVDPG